MKMLPRHEAQSQLDAIHAVTIGFGGVKAGDRQRYVGRLERLAMGEHRAAPATPGALAAMGVAVVIVSAEGDTDG